MALVVICGHPCSGKSAVAGKLAASFSGLGLEVVVVDEPSLHLVRNESYKSAAFEKQARAKLKSAVERSLSKKTVVILDSMNSIKGYRYELWCVARSTGTKYCMVHVNPPIEQCRLWNGGRQGDAYSAEIFDDLAGRFERPDARNRWDSPLFTVHPAGPAGDDSCLAPQAAPIVAVASGYACQVSGPPSEDGPGPAGSLGETEAPEDFSHVPEEMDLPCEGPQGEAQELAEIVAAMTDRGPGSRPVGTEPPSSSSARQAQARLTPTFATNATPMLDTNTLHDIDQAAQDIVTAIVEAQAAAVGGAPGIVRFSQGLQPLQMEQPVTLAELRRHKRAFLKLATKILFARLQDSATASRMFIDYLRDNVTGASNVHR